MKNYNVSEYQNWNNLAADLTADLRELVGTNLQATHKNYGECTISGLTVSISDTNFNILGDFTFSDQTKKIALNVVVSNGLVHIPNTEVLEAVKNFITSCINIQNEIRTVAVARITAAREAARKAAEEAKQAAKYKATMEKVIHDFEALSNQDRTKCATGEFYYNLGWLAKNVGTVSAALPDYLLPYFEKQFGTTYVPTIVDSKKRTVNGHPMQWTLSMKASLSKKSLDTIPAFLRQYLNPTGNSLTSTSFIWDLVENYGFKFGKTQDLAKIKDSLPSHCVEYFEKGYAA
jgi:hypothetical protein